MGDGHRVQHTGGIDAATGRRGALRTLGLGSVGALAGLGVVGETNARKQRRQDRAERQAAQAEKKKKKKKGGGAAGPAGPAGISGAAFDFVEQQNRLGINQSWTDLAVVSPRVSITVPASGRVLVMLTATFEHGGNSAGAWMGFEGAVATSCRLTRERSTSRSRRRTRER